MYSLQRYEFQISFAAGSAVMMRGSVQGFGFGFPDIEEQSMLAAKTGAKAKTVSDGFRKGCSAPTGADSIHDIGMV
jgi:hypothetical protein